MIDDQALEVLASEDDEDAMLILQFEDAASEVVQNDQELGALFSTYQDAQRDCLKRCALEDPGVSRRAVATAKV